METSSFNNHFEDTNFLTQSLLPDSNSMANYSTRNGSLSTNFTRICGYVGFCDYSDYDVCNEIPINICKQCSQLGTSLFLFLVITLGLAIVIGNFLIIAVGIHLQRKGHANKMDVCRSSLAVTDFLTGVQILVVTMYNYSWSTKLTPSELNVQQLALRGSVQAFWGAFLYLLAYTSSIYHLLYMSLKRLYAITKPIKYKFESKKNVYIGLGVVWAFAIVAATVPAWIPNHLTSSYIVPIFLYLPTLTKFTTNQDFTPLIALVFLFYIVPSFLMTVLTISCGVRLRVNFIRKNRQFQGGSSSAEVQRKEQIAVVKTLAIMQLGFTITLIPVIIVVLSFISGQLTCMNFSTPYLVGFYLSMSNSLVNVIVYNVRDKAFRNNVKTLCSKCFTCWSRVEHRSTSFQSRNLNSRHNGEIPTLVNNTDDDFAMSSQLHLRQMK